MHGTIRVELLCGLLLAGGCGPMVEGTGAEDCGQDDEPTTYGPGPGGDPSAGAGGTGDADGGPDSGAGETADGGDPGPLPDPGTPVLEGDGFIDAFFTDDGLYVVHVGGVDHVSRTGELLHAYESPRTIESAAFDGEWLGVADQAMLIVLDRSLQLEAEGSLVEGCRSAVMVSGPRFVCGPENDWDRLFYTYDALSGELLGTSDAYTYNGIPMRRVPGTDDFVTVTIDSSPSDFFLYTAAEDPVVYINESPYHGDFAVNLAYAFVGVPATHVVQTEGIMLRIYGDDCVLGSPYGADCFVKDGELGTLPAGAYGYIDLREGADGFLYGLVDAGAGWGLDPLCTDSPCELQRIDPQARTVVATTELLLTGQEFALVRPDPAGTGVAVIAGWGAPFSYSFEDRTDYEVLYLAY